MTDFLMFGGTILIVVTVVMLVISVALYLLNSVARLKFFKAMGYRQPGLAFVPVVSSIIVISLATYGRESVQVLPGVGIPQGVFKFYQLIAFGIGLVPVIGTLLSLVVNVICGFRANKAVFGCFEGYDEDSSNTTVMAVISIFVPFVLWYKFLTLEC